MHIYGSSRKLLAYQIGIVLLIYWVFGIIEGFTFQRIAPLNYIVIVFSLAIIAIFVLLKLFQQIDHRIDGMRGEYKVDAILSEMYSDGVRHVNDLLFDKYHGNVDHVAITQKGVWVLETKHMSGDIGFAGGKLTRDGVPLPKDPLFQVKRNVQDVKNFLASRGFKNIPVQPLIVFSKHPSVHFGTKPVEGVVVIGFTFLRKILLNQRNTDCIEMKDVNKMVKILSEKEQED